MYEVGDLVLFKDSARLSRLNALRNGAVDEMLRQADELGYGEIVSVYQARPIFPSYVIRSKGSRCFVWIEDWIEQKIDGGSYNVQI